MGKTDDKGEPVKTVTIGGKKVEVPIIFVLPEEAGEKEIERYERPKVHIDSKKFAPLVAAGAVLGAAEGITDKVDELDLPTPEAETIKTDSKEEPLDELTDGKLEEVEKLPDEEETPYFDLLSDKPKKKEKPKDVSYRALFDKGYGKAQALRRSVEEQKKRGAKTDDELAEESKKKIPKGQKGMLNYNYLFDKPDIEEKKDYLTDEEGDEIEKSWEKWLQKKQTRIDRKQEWGDKSKIGVGSWEDNPELKPKGRFDKDGKRIRERGQGEGKPREGAL